MRSLGCLAIAAAVGLVACGPAPKNPGARILPDLSPVSYGDLYPLPSGQQPDYGSNQYVPYAHTIFLQSEGSQELDIKKICIVGDKYNVFSLMGPDISKVQPQHEAAVQITYSDQTVRSSPDNIALVVQSNAVDYPTLVIPVCAQTIANGGTRGPVDCTSPVSVKPGKTNATLCK